jgi:class 3 adenylate cyclase
MRRAIFRATLLPERGAASERLDRLLVAVMFADMVGYTALMQADEASGTRQARPIDERRTLIRALRYIGRLPAAERE